MTLLVQMCKNIHGTNIIMKTSAKGTKVFHVEQIFADSNFLITSSELAKKYKMKTNRLCSFSFFFIIFETACPF